MFYKRMTAAMLISFALSGIAKSQDITPEPLKLPAAEFPVPSASFDKLVASNDVTAMRAHAWSLWSGITADSSQRFDGKPLPVWETWISEDELFPGGHAAMMSARATTRRFRSFTIPKQFLHDGRQFSAARVTAANPKVRLLASVKFSPDSQTFVAGSHVTPANAPDPAYDYKRTAELERLNAAFDAKNVPISDRKIVDFPPAAIDLKIVYMPVKASGLTPLPVWNGEDDSSNPQNPTPPTWKTCVAVDPQSSRSGTAQVDCNGKMVDAEIVPLSAFYSFRLSADEARTANQLLALGAKDALVENDYNIVVAVHITTKEIANWTWQTYWWQNGKNPPNKYPGSIDGMLDSSRIKGPWRNFAMCISNSMVVPYNDPKGAPVVCSNPWLETKLEEGIRSNCMTCHMRAAFAPLGYPDTYLPNGWLTPSDPVFTGTVKTDFVWAIPDNAR